MRKPDEIRALLARLGNRPWPDVWSKNTAATVGDDFYGWSHRYRLNPPASALEVRAFEATQGIVLPTQYRNFLLHVGNGGAGPAYGVFPLGTCEGEPFDEPMLAALSQEFDPDVAEDWDSDEERSRDVMQGAMIISSEGCARWYWLIVSGPNAGEIWYDARTDGAPPEPVLNEESEPIAFNEWYESWLVEAEKKWLSS